MRMLLPRAIRRTSTKPIDALVARVTQVGRSLRKEQEVSHELHDQIEAVVRRHEREHPGFRATLDRAYAYAVFPSVGRASAVLGGTFGRGEVFRHGMVVGYAGLVQLTIGVQLGGQTFTEYVLFDDAQAFERFREGKVRFASNASAVAVRSGALATNDGQGTTILVATRGGFLLEAALGGQKFVFRPAALTRAKRLRHLQDDEQQPRATGRGRPPRGDTDHPRP